MKIMFVTNDRSSKPQRWVNGTVGYVKEMSAGMNDVSSVTIDIPGKAIEVCREDVREYEPIDGITQIVGTINKNKLKNHVNKVKTFFFSPLSKKRFDSSDTIFYLCISGSFGNDFI
jgi:hypothetical protein